MSQRYSTEAAAASANPRRLDETPEVDREDRNRQAAALLRQWMSEDDGYDREIWPILEEELKDLRTRLRE
jgi:hypothetical protein